MAQARQVPHDLAYRPVVVRADIAPGDVEVGALTTTLGSALGQITDRLQETFAWGNQQRGVDILGREHRPCRA